MMYLLLPVGLTIALIGYLCYRLFFQRNTRNLRGVIFPSLFFLAAWIAIYYFLLA